MLLQGSALHALAFTRATGIPVVTLYGANNRELEAVFDSRQWAATGTLECSVNSVPVHLQFQAARNSTFGHFCLLYPLEPVSAVSSAKKDTEQVVPTCDIDAEEKNFVPSKRKLDFVDSSPVNKKARGDQVEIPPELDNVPPLVTAVRLFLTQHSNAFDTAAGQSLSLTFYAFSISSFLLTTVHVLD